MFGFLALFFFGIHYATILQVGLDRRDFLPQVFLLHCEINPQIISHLFLSICWILTIYLNRRTILPNIWTNWMNIERLDLHFISYSETTLIIRILITKIQYVELMDAIPIPLSTRSKLPHIQQVIFNSYHIVSS